MIKQLSGLDTFFLAGERPKQAMNLTGVGIYDPSLRASGAAHFDEIVAYARERVQRSPLFRRKLVSSPFNPDFPFWTADPHFSADRHVFHCVLPKPGTRQQLNEAVARIHGSVIDRAGPLWEWWFIEGLEAIDGVPPGCFAIAFKLHHAAFDGVSGWEVIRVSHDFEPGQDPGDGGPCSVPGGPKPPMELDFSAMAKETVARFLATPVRASRVFKDMLSIARKAIRGSASDFPLIGGVVPATPFNLPMSGSRTHASVPVSLAQLKQIRTLVPGSTINDAVLAIISGGMRRYLTRHEALPERSLVVGVPISIRAAGDESAAGNQALLAALPIGTDIANATERLQHLFAATAAKKRFLQTIPAFSMTLLADFVPRVFQNLVVRAFTDLKLASVVPNIFNFIVTNVPASRVPLYFLGSKMISYSASGPIWDGAGMIHAVTSYLDMLCISIDADGALMPDADVYAACIGESLTEYLQISAATVLPEQSAPIRAGSRSRAPVGQ